MSEYPLLEELQEEPDLPYAKACAKCRCERGLKLVKVGAGEWEYRCRKCREGK